MYINQALAFAASRTSMPIIALASLSILTTSCTSPQSRHAHTLAKGPEVKFAAANSVPGSRPTTAPGNVAELADTIAGELARVCPVAAPNDLAALDQCRKAMFAKSAIRASLSPVTSWGRQNLKNPETPLKDTNLSQFGIDVLTGMYLPLFMFNGNRKVTYVEREKLYRIELGAAFRNRLPPGQFPYPFWHNDEKWATYQAANAVYLWVDPERLKITHAQFTPRGAIGPNFASHPVAYKFDGKWMWTDANGEEQPKVTLFDGQFKPDNPYIAKLDSSYKQLALSLRDGQCLSCHVPDNPFKINRLVLLQTPAHAAAEISRVLKAVNSGRMPLDEYTGIEHPLSEEIKGPLLERATEFEAMVHLAKKWEEEAGGLQRQAKLKPSEAISSRGGHD
jgi:hypothetical protein